MSAIAVDDSERALIQPNAQHRYTVTAADLPLCCPMPAMHLWNSHPRVYLAIEPTGWAKCPYCGAEYSLSRGGAQDLAAAVR
ncbi:MAG TPA: zinc-finger domain-containing protein [Steroidobacteraceae bacterium]|nr:zinc-finger domain-containing protein [Steroidobacteraceae bacterium]